MRQTQSFKLGKWPQGCGAVNTFGPDGYDVTDFEDEFEVIQRRKNALQGVDYLDCLP